MPPPPPPLYHHPSAVQQTHVVEEYEIERDSHGIGLADLFDISLTGIAFLSFGMFVLQVLMCITMVSIFYISDVEYEAKRDSHGLLAFH